MMSDSSGNNLGLEEIFENLSIVKDPTNLFDRPILYRVVHSGSEPEFHGELRSRLYPPPTLKGLNRNDVSTYIEDDAIRGNRNPTPFISVTDDLIRAFAIAFRNLHDMEDVTIILICPWMLNPGNYIKLNDLRKRCGLDSYDIYNTETIVWGEIPARSILCRWQRSQILKSGLFDEFWPHDLRELTSKMGVKILRDLLKDTHLSRIFSPEEAAESLVHLGMDPSRFQIKQVFVFLLGRAAGYEVEKEMKSVEKSLKKGIKYVLLIEEFERATYELTKLVNKKQSTIGDKDGDGKHTTEVRQTKNPSETASDISSAQTKSNLQPANFEDASCLSFEFWKSQREKRNNEEREMHLEVDNDNAGLRKWVAEHPRILMITFESE